MMARPGISGAAHVAGIVGQPVAHSLSPVIHNTWITAAGLDAVYVPFAPADVAGFEALVAVGRAGLLAGLNVTAPFKEQAFGLADTASETARSAGSANILVFQAGRVRADSADGLGLMRALADQAPALDVTGRTVMVLGAGGAGRAAAAALAGAGASVRIANRSPDRASAVAKALGPAVTVANAADDLDGLALVINALSVSPDLDFSRLDSSTVVMDMTYRPVETPFLAAARARGLTTVDGLAMLIGQAGPSFQALFGQAAPDLDVRPLLLAALGEIA